MLGAVQDAVKSTRGDGRFDAWRVAIEPHSTARLRGNGLDSTLDALLTWPRAKPTPSAYSVYRGACRTLEVPDPGGGDPPRVFREVPGFPAESALDAVGQVGVAAIRDRREQVFEEPHEVRRHYLLL